VIRITQEKGAAVGFEAGKKRMQGVDVIERRINDKGFDLLTGGKTKEAITVFELGVMAFPKSAEAFDSLGETRSITPAQAEKAACNQRAAQWKPLPTRHLLSLAHLTSAPTRSVIQEKYC
jgi:hypothetical protein